LQEADFVCQSLGLARQAPARQCAPVANLRNILWLAARSTYGHHKGFQGQVGLPWTPPQRPQDQTLNIKSFKNTKKYFFLPLFIYLFFQ
jgi:hypothetical protein